MLFRSERVTECIPVEDKNEYTFDHRKEKTLEGKLDKFMDNATYYFTKSTNRELYKHVNILEYHDGEYILTNKISDTNIKEMLNNMDETDAEEFTKFIQKHWNTKINKYMEEEQGKVKQEPKKRGRKAKI